MPNEILIPGAPSIEPVRFFVTGSFSPVDAATNWSYGTPTDVALTLSGLAAGAGRQSLKIDLGALRAPRYALFGCVDFTGESTHVSGELVNYYWLPSTSGTQANANVAGNSGAAAAAPDGALGSITLAEMIDLGAQRIGRLIIHDGGVVQNGYCGSFAPKTQHGQLLVINDTTAPFEADDIEMHQLMVPWVPESQ